MSIWVLQNTGSAQLNIADVKLKAVDLNLVGAENADDEDTVIKCMLHIIS